MTRLQTPPLPTSPLPDFAEALTAIFAGAAPPRTLEAFLDWMERRK